jgi:hypothetical protein
MANHRVHCQRNPLNRTIGVGLVAGGIALGGTAFCVPATANADVQVGGQNNSPGAAGGNITGADVSNNTVVLGRNNTTRVNQTNQNSQGGNTNGSLVAGPRSGFGLPGVQIGGQTNSPGASGGNITLLRISNNTIVTGRSNTTTVNQTNQNTQGGNTNGSLVAGTRGGFGLPGVQIGGQTNSPGASGGNITGLDISNNTIVLGRGNTTQVNQANQNSSGGDRNGAATLPAVNTNPFLVPLQIGGQNNSPGASGGNITGIDASNNVLVIGANNTTRVDQANQNSSGGDRNVAANLFGTDSNPFLAPLQIGGQNNSPGVSGGNTKLFDASNNVLVIGPNNATRVIQANQNSQGGNNNRLFGF